MKKIRILREPKGGKSLIDRRAADDVHPDEFQFFTRGSVLEVPDEIAELFCAPRCVKCGRTFLGTDKECEWCPYQELVPGLAEMMEP